MQRLKDVIAQAAQQARGRCHSCIHRQTFDIPSGPRYWCRAYGRELSEEEQAAVRNCPRWHPLTMGVRRRAERNPLFQQAIEAEERVFWQLKTHLDPLGIDLKTLLILMQPSLRDSSTLRWVDELDDRYEGEPVAPLPDILRALRALGYESLCRLVEQALGKRC